MVLDYVPEECSPVIYIYSYEENWFWIMQDLQERIPCIKCNHTVICSALTHHLSESLPLFLTIKCN